MKDPATVQMPFEELRQIMAAAEKAGIPMPDIPGITRMAVQIDASKPVSQLAWEIGCLVAQRDIFLKGQHLVTVDKTTGVQMLMKPKRFVGWIEQFCSIRGMKNNASLTPDLAGTILEQDVFRDCIRPLAAVHLMRLPVRRQRDVASSDGQLSLSSGKTEFLEPGYDEASRIFTAPVLEYDMTWPVEKALDWFREHCADYPWVWPEDRKINAETGEPLPLESNRSYTVHIAGCVGNYCRALFRTGTKRPMMLVTGNQQGSGKTILIEMQLFPVYGSASSSKTPKDEDKMIAELETVAQSMRPYVFFDDVGHGLYYKALARFITASSHTGRIYGQNTEVYEVPAVTQVFATGMEVKMTRDIERRAMVAELFLSGDVAGRKYERTITSEYLAENEVRSGFLSASCALVKAWIENGQPLFQEPLESFEDWTATVLGILSLHPFANPLVSPELTAGGAEDENEMRELLIEVASVALTDGVYTREQLVTVARTHGLLEAVVGTESDDALDSSANKRFGRQLQHWRGRELRDREGRPFRFGHRRQKRGATYPLTFIATAKQAPLDHSETSEAEEPDGLSLNADDL